MRDYVIVEAIPHLVEMNLVDSRGERRDARVPAVRNTLRGQRAELHAIGGEVIDGDVDRGGRRGISPAAVEGVGAFGHPQDVACSLLGDVRAGTRRFVAAVVNGE